MGSNAFMHALDSLGKSSFILGSELWEEHFDLLLPIIVRMEFDSSNGNLKMLSTGLALMLLCHKIPIPPHPFLQSDSGHKRSCGRKLIRNIVQLVKFIRPKPVLG